MKKVAGCCAAHEPLILNWFRAKGEISNGAVEASTQNPSGYQTILRLSYIPCHGNRPLSQLGNASGTGNHPTNSAEEAKSQRRLGKLLTVSSATRCLGDSATLAMNNECSYPGKPDQRPFSPYRSPFSKESPSGHRSIAVHGESRQRRS